MKSRPQSLLNSEFTFSRVSLSSLYMRLDFPDTIGEISLQRILDWVNQVIPSCLDQ